MACNWQNPGGEFAENDLMRFDRPVQGIYKDCAFIAALSSYLWMQKTSMPPVVVRDGVSRRVFYFYERPRTKAVTIQVTEELCLPGQATSTNGSEYWPGLWEKAYAAFKYWLDHTELDPLTLPDHSDLSVLDGYGNPVTALVRLKGWPSFTFLNSSYNTADSLFLEIKKKVKGTKTTVPMVAWTYATAPAGIEYSDDQIAANHSYSILGLHYPSDDGRYIILRNPYANSLSEPTTDTVVADWNSGDTLWGNPVIPLGEQDGIFALEIDTFRRYFEGFGWVSLR